MEELKAKAKTLLGWRVEGCEESPNDWRRHDCQSRIGFALQLELITYSEAAAYCRRIGLEETAELYGKHAKSQEGLKSDLVKLANAGMQHACGLYPQE